jgi:uncharacterized protein (DUF2384 family)
VPESASPEANTFKKNVVCRAIDIYGGDLESALNWLLEPLPALNGHRPIDCIDDEKMAAQLKIVFTKLKGGEFP